MSLSRNVVLGLVAVAVLAILFYFFAARSGASGNAEVQTVRWLIAHEPSSLFAKGAAEFDRILQEESGGELKLELLAPTDVDASLVGVGDIPPETVFELLDEGQVEMSTILATGLAKQAPEVLEASLPFLFDDSDEARDVLYSERGKRLLERISEKTDTRALAFTLSGGFRVLVSTKPLELGTTGSIADKSIITTAGEVGEKTLLALGAQPLPTPNDISALPNPQTIDAVEATYTRLSAIKNPAFVKYVAETDHSLFFTTILVRDSFFDSLSPKNQAALQKAAAAAGLVEWDDSIELGQQVKEDLKAKGVVIEEMSPQLRAQLREQLKPVYDWFYATYGSLLTP